MLIIQNPQKKGWNQIICHLLWGWLCGPHASQSPMISDGRLTHWSQDSTMLKTGPSFGGAWQGGKAKGQPPGQYLATALTNFGDRVEVRGFGGHKKHGALSPHDLPFGVYEPHEPHHQPHESPFNHHYLGVESHETPSDLRYKSEPQHYQRLILPPS